MILKNYFGYESFECSKCGSVVDEFVDYCQVCGKSFENSSENKYKALDFSEGDFNNNSIIVATLKNSKLGVQKFIISSKSQIAMRVKYYVINGNPNFLEDGLMQESLVNLNEFKKIELNDELYYVEKLLL